MPTRLFVVHESNADVALDGPRKSHDIDIGCVIGLSDVAWGIRHDGGSQSGCLVGFAHRSAMDGVEPPFLIAAWFSRRLPRASRSSLNSEAQTASVCTGAIDWVKTFTLLHQPHADPRDEELTQDCLLPSLSMPAPCATVPENPASQISPTSGTASIFSSCPSTSPLPVEVRFPNTTKPQARQLLAGRLRCGRPCLITVACGD